MKRLAPLFALMLFTIGSALPLQGEDFPKGSPAFQTDFEKTMAAAKENGKPVIVIFSRIICGPCQIMKRDVYPSEAVKPFHDKFNWVYVDLDEASADKAREKFRFEYTPHTGFLSKSGKKLDDLSGFNDAKEFAKKLEGVLKKADAPTPSVGAKSK